MLFADLDYQTIRNASDKIAVLPLGAIEQHGPHLPVSTDFDIVSSVAREAEKKLAGDIILCPSLPFGSSHHHLHFAALSLSVTTYTQVLVEIVDSLVQAGFRRIVLLNGHGGNITPGRQALALLSNKYDVGLKPNIVFATYWELASTYFSGAPPMESPALSHACEYETSLLLYLFPEKVVRDKIQRSKRPLSNGYIPFEDDEPYRGVTMVKRTEFISGNGCSGEPQLGTVEKGKHLFNHAVNAFFEFIQSFKTWPFLDDLSK